MPDSSEVRTGVGEAKLEIALAALNEIALGVAPPQQHGHYLAHRAAVKLAREAVRSIAAFKNP